MVGNMLARPHLLGAALVVLIAAVPASAQSPAPATPSIGTPAAPIGGEAPAIDDRLVRIGAGGDGRFQVVCFLGTECPLARLYAGRLRMLAGKFADQQVTFIAMFSNRQDSLAEVRAYVAEHELAFPAIKDTGNAWADSFDATRTPEVFVLDRAGQVRYQGRIDDQYAPGVAREAPTTEDLSEALAALIEGRQPAVTKTEAVGCIIGRIPKATVDPGDSPVTYSAHISRLLQQHCVECHREGAIGPFALDRYDEVVGWGEMMLEVVQQGRMPPWHAAPPHDRFIGARGMSDDEIDLLRRWIDQGMPEGDPGQLPEPRQFVDGWDLPRSPEVVLDMSERPMEVPASGTVDYQYFVVDPGFEEERWVSAAQVIPGNARVVHHAICFVRPPDGSSQRGVGWLGAYVPGQRPAVLPPGHARRIPAGSKLVFQMHYTPTGKPETDITSVGMIFADPGAVTHEVITQLAIDQSFEIPPGVARHRVVAAHDRFPRHGRLLSIMPHMHVRGHSCTLDVVRADGTQRLLEVPRYDFNWQHDYRLIEPVALDDVERLEFTATFDNSAGNPWNPDPTQTVTWGDQTWEEMAVAFFDIAIPLNPADSTEQREETPVDDATLETRRQRFVDEFFERLDGNGDGVVEESEMPESLRAFGSWQFDQNGDGRVERQEVLETARHRITL